MSNSKKRILIINSHFGIGGIETAMVNMANALCEEYDIDLFVYYPEGPMKERLNPRVNILKTNFAFQAIGMSMQQTIQTRNPLLILFKLFGSTWSRIFDNRFPIFIASMMQKKLGEYDLAIAFRQEVGKHTLLSGFSRFLNSRVEANSKAIWIHYDATYFSEYQEFNEKYYEKADKIVGVSKSVANVYKKLYPQVCDKVDYCYNFMDCDMVLRKSNEEQPIEYPDGNFICFSACRFEEKQKKVVRSIKAIAPVLKEYPDVMWYIAGDGPDRNAVENAIQETGMQERIILLGNQSNPYTYMKNSDLMMLLSFHEAAPMVYMEAKTLGVPVFTTCTLSSEEMLDDGLNAFICENSEEGIRDAFADLMANRERIAKVKENLKDFKMSNVTSIEKIREFIERDT